MAEATVRTRAPHAPGSSQASYKTVLVQAERHAVGCSRIRAAAEVAQMFDASLVGVAVAPFQPASDPAFGFVDAQTLVASEERHERTLEEARQALEEASCGRAVFRGSSRFATDAMIEHARCADLVVATRRRRGAGPACATPADLVMGCGVPVLLMPDGQEEIRAKTVVIGWKDTREARRALGDALPFLCRAERVVLAALFEGEDAGEVSLSATDAADRLRGHGVPVELEMTHAADGWVMRQLLDIASAYGSDLLVIGAYGHTRAREWLLGGVTSDVLEDASIPVLLSR